MGADGGGEGWGWVAVGVVDLGDVMSYFVNEFNAKEIDAAGRVLAKVPGEGEDDSEWVAAFEMVSQWRGTHAGPLRTFRGNLGRRVGRTGIVAQRLKRMPTIISKLERLPWLKLSRMQDIGGCRAIVPTNSDAFVHATNLLDSRIRHRLIGYKDFITYPRSSGYRGLHLVYSYNSERTDHWQGLKIEIQIRSLLQHQWATAVEIVGTFTNNDLKSSAGDEAWLRFFALMSNVIAERENSPAVPDTPTNMTDLVNELKGQEAALEASRRLIVFQAITHELRFYRDYKNPWIVLELDVEKQRIRSRPFKSTDQDYATAWYAKRELESRKNPYTRVVMVSARSVNELKRAYPNYFTDLSDFRALVRETIE